MLGEMVGPEPHRWLHEICQAVGASVAQLLSHQERITDLLREHINSDNYLYLEPLLE